MPQPATPGDLPASDPIQPAPVSFADRYLTLDVLRGVAILGILVMNIQSFAMPMATYSNPALTGHFSGVNVWIWALSYLFTAEKFMTLFSMLFGAGVALMTSRLEAKGIPSAPLHYRRMLWLVLIGLVHAYALWFGDVLVTYALCGLGLFFFRHLRPRTLLITGICVFAVTSGLALMSGLSLPYWPEEQRAATLAEWQPSQAELAEEIEAYRGDWWEQMEKRVPQAWMLESMALVFFVMWKAGGLMLIGMALFKWGILTGEAPSRTYRRLMLAGFGIGFPLVLLGTWRNLEEGFAAEWSMFLGGLPNYWGSALVSIGYVCAICLLLRRSSATGWPDRLAAVGRMAFTNYLLQTVICTTIFYGHGLGLFGRVERPGQVAVVLAVWAFQLVASPVWLRHFRFGPAEWLWRSLTYGRPQPMRLG